MIFLYIGIDVLVLIYLIYKFIKWLRHIYLAAEAFAPPRPLRYNFEAINIILISGVEWLVTVEDAEIIREAILTGSLATINIYDEYRPTVPWYAPEKPEKGLIDCGTNRVNTSHILLLDTVINEYILWPGVEESAMTIDKWPRFLSRWA